jgi:hypothetical protein
MLLLSFLHRGVDVEKRAAGAIRIHWTEGTRNERMASGFVDARPGRIICEGVMAAIAIVALPLAMPTQCGRKMRDARRSGKSLVGQAFSVME